jgi:hypothetical protein
MSIVTGIIVAVVLTPLTIGDVFAVGLALIPTGWGLLSVNIFPSLSLGEFGFVCTSASDLQSLLIVQGNAMHFDYVAC